MSQEHPAIVLWGTTRGREGVIRLSVSPDVAARVAAGDHVTLVISEVRK